MVVDQFEHEEAVILIYMDRVEHPAMDRFRLRAAYEGGGLVNGFEYSLDAIVEDDFPMESVAKTRMGQVMIQRCREDVLNAEWEGYEMDLKAVLEQTGA